MSQNDYVEFQMNNQVNPNVPPQSMDDAKPTSRLYYQLSGCGMFIFWTWTTVNFILQSNSKGFGDTSLQLSIYMFMMQGVMFGVAAVLAWWTNVSCHWGSHLITCIYNLMCIMMYLMDVELTAGFHVWNEDSFPACFSSPQSSSATMCQSYQATTIFSLLITCIHATWCCLHGSYLLKNIAMFKNIIRNPSACTSLCLGFLNFMLFFATMVITIYNKEPIASSPYGSNAWVISNVYLMMSTLCLLYHAYQPTIRNTFFTLCWCSLTAGLIWSYTIANLKSWTHYHDLPFDLQASCIINVLLSGLHTIATGLFIIQLFFKIRGSSRVSTN